MLAKEPTARPTMEQVTAQLQRLFQGGRDSPSIQLPTLAVDSEDRATVQAKALGGKRKSAEISGSELAVTAALRVKKLPIGKSAERREQSLDGSEAGAFDPTSPGDPNFVAKLGAVVDNASTIPIQSMQLSDLHPAVKEKQRKDAAAAGHPADKPPADKPPADKPPAPGPPSGPGQLSGGSWVPMEIVKTDYQSAPEMSAERSRKRSSRAAPPARPLLPWLLLLVAILLVALTVLLVVRLTSG